MSSDAYYDARSAVLRAAQASGAPLRERSIWPGSASTMQYAEPLAGLRAARILEDTARRVTSDYIRYARQDGATWAQIGEALSLDAGGERSGYDLAVAAHEHATGEPEPFRHPTFGWMCPDCGQGISDYGPYESHPADREHGHSDSCTRLGVQVAAWQAERDTWEAGE